MIKYHEQYAIDGLQVFIEHHLVAQDIYNIVTTVHKCGIEFILHQPVGINSFVDLVRIPMRNDSKFPRDIVDTIIFLN